MPSPSITGSVADLFATLGLDVGPLSAALSESKMMIKEAGADMSMSLGALENRFKYVTTALSGGMIATNAYEAALASLGIQTGNNIKLTNEQAAALQAELPVLDQLIMAEQGLLATRQKEMQLETERIQFAAIERDLANQRIALNNQMAAGEARAAAIAQASADAQVAAANQIALGEARAEAIRLDALAAEQVLADERIALANQIAIGTARAEAIQTEATAAAVAERIKLANQYAEAEVRAAAIVKEAQAADALPFNIGARAGRGGISPTLGSGAGGMIAGAAAAFIGYETIKQFSEFDDAMNKSLSIMKDVTEFQKSEMIRVSKDLALQYGVSANEIMHAFYTMESAGRTTEEALKDMPSVVQFAFTGAADGVMKVATSAETLTSVFNALKGSGGSIEHISDLLLKADSIAQGTGEQFAKALAGKGAGAIQILGKSAEEGLAILATMAKVGIPAAQQQQALIQLMRDLPKEAEKYQSVIITLNGHQMTFKELLYDSTGQMKDFSVILKELETLFNGASTEVIQHDLALLHLNSRTNQSLQAMLGLSGTLADYEAKLKNAKGTTQAMAAVRLDAFKTQWDKLGESIRVTAIDLGTVLAPPTKVAIGLLTQTMNTVHDLTQGYIALAEAAYNYATGNRAPAPPKPPPAPTNVPNFGSGSVEDPEGDAKKKAAAERAAQERNRIQNIRLTAAQKAEEELVTLEANAIKQQQALHQISDEEAERALLATNEKMLKIQESYELKKLALEVTKKSPVYEATVEAQMSAANSRKAAMDQKVSNDAELREQKRLIAQQKVYNDYQKNLTEGFAEYDRQDAAHNQKLIDDQLKADNEMEANDSRHKTALMENARTVAAYLQSTGQLSANERLAIDSALDAKEEDIQRAAVQRQLDNLEKVGRGDVTYASRKQALLDQLDAMNDKRTARELKTRIALLRAGEDEINQVQNQIRFEQEYGNGVVSVMEREERLKKAVMELHILRNQSNSMELIQLEMVRVKTQAAIDKQHEWGLMMVETGRNLNKLWHDFGDKVAEGILAGGKFWHFWHDMIHQFEVDMLKTLINGVLKTLKDNLLALPGVSSTIGKIAGLGGGGIAGAGQQAASLTQQTTAITASTVAENANTTALTTLTGVLTGNIAATGANVVATTGNAIVTGINAHAVAVNTVTKTWSTLKYSFDSGVNTTALGVNSSAEAANTAAVTAATTGGDVAKAAGGLPGLGGGGAGAAGSAGGFASIFNMVTGAVTAISSVVGNFQMAGMNKTLDLIENYTRYLKIGLVEQGDSLLNDSHTIRNTLTDLMAYMWGVQATYLQGISEKLDALIGAGGVSGVTVKPQLAMAGGGSMDYDLAAAGENMTNDSGVTIDLSGSTFEAEVSERQVDAVFTRGVDKAKRAGAFRGGTWPR